MYTQSHLVVRLDSYLQVCCFNTCMLLCVCNCMRMCLYARMLTHVYGWLAGLGGWVCGWTDGRMDGWKWMDGHIYIYIYVDVHTDVHIHMCTHGDWHIHTMGWFNFSQKSGCALGGFASSAAVFRQSLVLIARIRDALVCVRSLPMPYECTRVGRQRCFQP